MFNWAGRVQAARSLHELQPAAQWAAAGPAPVFVLVAVCQQPQQC